METMIIHLLILSAIRIIHMFIPSAIKWKIIVKIRALTL